MDEKESKVMDDVFMKLAGSMEDFTMDGLGADYSMYKFADPDEDNDWPGIVIYNADDGDVLMTYRPYETDDGDGFMLCFKVWHAPDDSKPNTVSYNEWCFPLPSEEPDFSYISHALDLFYEANREGFAGVYSEEVPGSIKEMTRLNGLKDILERIGVSSTLTMQEDPYPCLWIYDEYMDEETEEDEEREQGCLLKLSYLCIREDDSEWILSVECSRNPDPEVRLIIPEGAVYQDEEMYRHILEIAESIA